MNKKIKRGCVVLPTCLVHMEDLSPLAEESSSKKTEFWEPSSSILMNWHSVNRHRNATASCEGEGNNPPVSENQLDTTTS